MTPDQERALILARARRRRAEAEQKQQSDAPQLTGTDILGAAVEPNLALLSGAIAAPAAGIAGLVGAAWPGKQGQGADWVRNVQSALTYQPKTEGGRRAMSVIGAPFEKYGEATNRLGEWSAEQTKSPAVGAGVKTALDAGPALLMAKGISKFRDKGAAAREGQAARNRQLAKVYDRGREQGLKTPPAHSNPTFLNRMLEGAAGEAPIAKDVAINNQNLAYRIAAREASLKAGESITRETLRAARERIAAPYREVAALHVDTPLARPPFKGPAAILESLKKARYDAKQKWKQHGRSGDPAHLEEARALSKKADALDQQLEVIAVEAGRPELAQALRDSRAALAKNYTVQRGLKGSNFDSAALARLESRGDIPMAGPLGDLIEFQRDFPQSMRAPQTGGGFQSNQVFPLFGMLGGGATGHAFGGPTAIGPGAVAGYMAGQTVGPAARSMLLSNFWQNKLGRPQQPPRITTNEALTFSAAVSEMKED